MHIVMTRTQTVVQNSLFGLMTCEYVFRICSRKSAVVFDPVIAGILECCDCYFNNWPQNNDKLILRNPGPTDINTHTGGIANIMTTDVA